VRPLLDAAASGAVKPAREKFTGKELDEDGKDAENGVAGVGLEYFGMRYYDQDVGVWTAQDPMLQYWDGYSYVGKRPIGLVDPDGLYSANWGGGSFGEALDNAYLGMNLNHEFDPLDVCSSEKPSATPLDPDIDLDGEVNDDFDAGDVPSPDEPEVDWGEESGYVDGGGGGRDFGADQGSSGGGSGGDVASNTDPEHEDKKLEAQEWHRRLRPAGKAASSGTRVQADPLYGRILYHSLLNMYDPDKVVPHIPMMIQGGTELVVGVGMVAGGISGREYKVATAGVPIMLMGVGNFMIGVAGGLPKGGSIPQEIAQPSLFPGSGMLWDKLLGITEFSNYVERSKALGYEVRRSLGR